VLLYTPDPDLPSDPPNGAGKGNAIFLIEGCTEICDQIPVNSKWSFIYVISIAGDYFFHITGSGFNISWLKGGHPLLNVGDLAMEASQSLRLLLDQLKLPQVKSLSNSMIIVLINRSVFIYPTSFVVSFLLTNELYQF